MANPRYRQLLEFCANALIDSMSEGELPDGVVLAVIGEKGSYSISADTESLPYTQAMIVAGAGCQAKGLALMRAEMGDEG